MIKLSKITPNYYKQSDRILAKIEGSKNAPTVVVIAGIHGNESAGVEAAKRVLHKIKEENIMFNGNLYMLLGNINGLNKGVRFEDVDLNRIWKKENIDTINNNYPPNNNEVKEQIEIYKIIKDILKNEIGPFYFLDLHTTSAASVPFITISDSLNNRKFSSNFPVPVVLGIEEYLDGPLLTFINEYGHVALGFEGGEHYDEKSIINCEAFIWKALVHSKCLSKKNISNYKKYKNNLSKLCCKYEFFEINYRYVLKNDEDFKMNLGFENFEKIKKNQQLALSNGAIIKANENGRIFMPLYQELGEDGFFILQKISKFWLKASLIARRLKINHFLRLIPGVEKAPENNYTLIVDPKIAKYLAKDIFHLFGYRKQIFIDEKYHFIKRDRKITNLD
ncbi:MAG: aspartoacylase [Flavobacteriaceae bacterium]|nr:aspartoacylase [Flavobacteriaceae bacterium]